MFRIRRIWDHAHPRNQRALKAAQSILSERFSDLPARDVERVRQRLHNPFEEGLRPIIVVAEGTGERVLGCAVVLHDPAANYALLEYLATRRALESGGIGAALYETVRSEARALACRGLFFECLPDDDVRLSDESRKLNAARLRFYESWNARPIIGTAYETSVDPTDTSPAPLLVVDRLDSDDALDAAWLRNVVRSILEKKYGHLCPPEYVEGIVRSIRKGTVGLREPRYAKPETKRIAPSHVTEEVALLVNDRHEIHHVRERGYVEAPVRIARILESLEPTGWFVRKAARDTPRRLLDSVHDAALVRYIERACAEQEDGRSLYPYVFPVRNRTRPPRERTVLAGYWCLDTFTPIHRNAFAAARGAVDCAVTAALTVADGARFAYALVRPPGHHAEHDRFGGFCYFNNAAVAAQALVDRGKVAILDIDYHHGNGQQDIFWNRRDVLTVSVHGNPRFAYPYYAGFEDERGAGEGEGFNHNIPLPEKLDGSGFRVALRKALDRVADFHPAYLVVSLGLDTARGDPTGTWTLEADDFRENGRMIAEVGLPTVVIQEGGYRTRTLGRNCKAFFHGLLHK